MSRLIVLVILCLSVLTPANVAAAQDASDLEAQIDEPVPIARLGWGQPYSLTYTPDGQSLVVSTRAGITFYDENLNEQRHIDLQDHTVGTPTFSPNGRILATGVDEVGLWDVETGAHLGVLAAGDEVSGLAFNSDASLLAVTRGMRATGDTYGIEIFDVATRQVRTQVALNFAYVTPEFLPDGEHLIARRVYDCCGKIILLNIRTGEIQESDYESYAYRVLPGADQVLSFEMWVGWRVLDLSAEGLPEVRVGDYPSDAYRMTVSPIDVQGQFVALVGDGQLTTWDIETLTQQDLISFDLNLWSAAFSPDASRLAVIDWDFSTLTIINTQTGEIIAQVVHPPTPAAPMIFHGDTLIFAREGGSIGSWHIWTDEVGAWRGHDSKVTALVTDEAGVLYSSSEDGTVRVWESPTDFEGKVLFEQPEAQIMALTLSGDDLFAVVCENYANARLIRLDKTSGASLGFFPDEAATEPTLTEISLDTCEMTFIPAPPGDVRYGAAGEYSTVVWIQGQRASNITRLSLPIRHAVVFGTGYDPEQLLIGRLGAALTWSPFSYGETDVAASHDYEITALAQVGLYMYASAACESQYTQWPDSSRYCAGNEMALTDFAYNTRTPLVTAHRGIVRQIVKHPTLAAFASLSDDGTIILWGNLREPMPVRRIIPRLMG